MSDPIVDALYDRIDAATDWNNPSKLLRSATAYTPPTFDFIRVSEDPQYNNGHKGPTYFNTYGLKMVLSPSHDASTYVGYIKSALEWLEGTDPIPRQYSTTLGGLVQYARIESIDYFQTQGASVHEALITIAVLTA